ncbi:hypothetical protein D3C87_1754200 [compost metagenome]
MLERGKETEVIQQRRPQIARHPSHLVEHRVEPVQRHAQHRRHRRALGRRQLEPVRGGLQHQLHRHQQLADAIVQLAREPRALLFLRLHHPPGQLVELGVRLAVVAHVEREAARRHQQDADAGNHADPRHGLADVGFGTRVELA